MTSADSPRRLTGPVYEWTLPALGAPDEPERLCTAHALRCVSPTGRRLSIPALWDGAAWRARLWAWEPGVWRWHVPGPETGGELTVAEASEWPTSPLTRSSDRRFLTDASGTPRFYLGDTAWFVIWKGAPDQWAKYLDRRREQGFTVIGVHLLPFHLENVDAEGNLAFVDEDVNRPNERYFERVDRFCQMAAERGLYVMFALMWGGPLLTHQAPNFTTDQAQEFARWAVARYGCFPVIWSLSGDAPYVRELEKWEAVGEAVRAIDPYDHPRTNHLQPSMNWLALHHNSPWFDFHTIQTGHYHRSAEEIADLARHYYSLQPTKGYLDGEPWYEGHPGRDEREYGPLFTARDARFAFWVSVLSGATMGHVYGGQGIWNWKRPGDDENEQVETPRGRIWAGGPQIGPPWSEAVERPGAIQCGLAAKWLSRQPWWSLAPCPEQAENRPWPDAAHRPAAAKVAGSLYVVYLPTGEGRLRVKGLEMRQWRASWLDPRAGEESEIGDITPAENRVWEAPAAPSPEDWVLVLRAQP